MYALNNESMYPDMVTSSYSFYVYTTALNLYQINPITVCLKADTSRLDYDGGISSTSGTNLALTIASATDNSITNEAIVFELDMSAPQPAKVYKKYVKITFPEGTTDYTIYFGCVSPIISFNNGTEDIKAFMQYYMSVSNTINSHTADMTFEIKAWYVYKK